MPSRVPDMYEDSGYDRELICLCVSALRRQPGWLLVDVWHHGLWDDLMIAALQPVLEGISDKKECYNAAQRSVYRCLRNSGYRKAKVVKKGVTKVLWQPIRENRKVERCELSQAPVETYKNRHSKADKGDMV